jgi:transposase
MPVSKRLQPVFDVGIDERIQQFLHLAIGDADPLFAEPTKKILIDMKRRLAAVDDELSGIAAQLRQFAGIENTTAAVGFPENILLPGTGLLSGKIHRGTDSEK